MGGLAGRMFQSEDQGAQALGQVDIMGYVYLPQCYAVLVLFRLLEGVRPSAPRGSPTRIGSDFIRTKTAVKGIINPCKPPCGNRLWVIYIFMDAFPFPLMEEHEVFSKGEAATKSQGMEPALLLRSKRARYVPVRFGVNGRNEHPRGWLCRWDRRSHLQE